MFYDPILKRNKKNIGFSLVEMAVVISIAGIMLASITQSYSIYMESRRTRVTYDRMSKIKDVLQKFYEVQGRYPCPANPKDVVYGVENCSPNLSDGYVKEVDGRDFDGSSGSLYSGDNNILVGAIPYKTIMLGIQDKNPYDNNFGDDVYNEDDIEYSEDYVSSDDFLSRKEISDDWGRQFTYIVSLPLTAQETYNNQQGAIYVETENGTPLVTPAGSAAWVVLSHGDNGAGAYLDNGEKYFLTDCEGVENNKDNCDLSPSVGGMTIISSMTNKNKGSGYYDDIVFFSKAMGGSFWDKARNDPTRSGHTGVGSLSSKDIYNKNIGFVGIGTKNPVQRLDINGFLESRKIVANTICNEDGSKCINPVNFISKCNGQVISGISSGGFICGGAPSPLAIDLTTAKTTCVDNAGDTGACGTDGICNTGYYALGISADGKVICGLP